MCKGKGLLARGYESMQGFVVKAGSQVAGQVVPSMAEHLPGMMAKRQDLIDSGVLAPQGVALVFTQDYAFTSPSTPASIVLGRSANGRVEWKDAQGRALKVLQADA